MKTYLKRLKAHPGVPLASILTPIFIATGLTATGLAEGHPMDGLLVGVGASVMTWAIVLWTARDQPIRDKS